MKLVAAVTLLGLLPGTGLPQGSTLAPHLSADRPDSVTVVPGAKYTAGRFYRFWFGDTYRHEWTTPVHVEVLDLNRFAGGLHAVKEGGGLETKSLRLVSAAGREYVFRRVAKTPVSRNNGPVMDDVFRDEISASLPFGACIAARLLDAVGVLHASPTAVVMPDDPALGEFRSDFGGYLGTIEEYPSAHDPETSFAGAAEVIDSDKLLKLLDKDPHERVDARALLTARLMDMFMNDIDRHPGQWKWARMQKKPASPWIPIPRDRDQAFISFDGAAVRLAHLIAPKLLPFHGEAPNVSGLSVGAIEFDRRLLGELERPVWDSITAVLVSHLSDSVITASVHSLPPEYAGIEPNFIAVLKRRRDLLPVAAGEFYKRVVLTPDIHGTDEADRLTVTRVDDRFVDVRLEAVDGTQFFQRRFDARETPEIRIYLHGGSDSAVVTGHVHRSIRVRIIGGNGTNVLTEASTVTDSHSRTHLYDQGSVKSVSYGLDTSFHRVPWVGEHGTLTPPGRDRGSKFGASAGIRLDRNLRAVPRLSLNRYGYAFGEYPYSTRIGLDAEYSTGINGFRIGVTADKRFARSLLHVAGRVRYSQLELINHHGLGNDTPGPDTSFIAVRQRQWLLDPAIGIALGMSSELTLGPVFQVAQTEVAPIPLALGEPYGFGHFAQLGMRLTLHHDARDQIAIPHRRFVLDASGTYTPAMLDVQSPFEEATATLGAYFTLPLRSMLALRGGGKKVFGDFPFQQAAFLGGGSTVRSLANQRFAGDASVFGTAEFRVLVARFNLFVPVDVGIVGLMDAGRVWLDGESPGGLHLAKGGGLWLSILHQTTTFSVASVSGLIRVGTLINTGLSFDKRPARHDPAMMK